MISKFNGSDLEIELDDVADHHPVDPTSPSSSLAVPAVTTSHANGNGNATTTAPVDIRKVDERTIFDAGDVDGSSSGSSPTTKSSTERPPLITQYDSIGQTPANALEGHSFKTPLLSTTSDAYPPPPKITLTSSSITATSPTFPTDENVQKLLRRQSTSASIRSARDRRSSIYEYEKKCSMLPRFIRKPLAAWWDRVSMVLEPEWFRTTVLVWAVWFAMSLGKSWKSSFRVSLY